MTANSAREGVALKFTRMVVAASLALTTGVASAAATIVIQNMNAAGVGFNDATPAAPVGGNAGTTLGQQRLIAFQAAADTWGATLTSSQTIVIRASFEPLTCTATAAVRGSAGAFNIWRDFPGAPHANTWYPQALANKIAGANLSAGDPVNGQDISARFNSRLGLFPDCLPGSPFYLGLDNNHGTGIDLVTQLLHEFAHGLGFQTFTNGSTGAQFLGFPSIWDHFLLDNTTNKLWVNMTDAERAASALNTGNLVWTGANVTNAAPLVLAAGSPQLQVSAPASIAGIYNIGTASFGAALTSAGVTRTVMPLVGTGSQLLGCDSFSAANALAVNGKIALIDRGVCSFPVKVKNAQNAGAAGVIIVNDVAGLAPGLGGSDPTIVIPTVSVSQADGNTLKSALQTRSRTTSAVVADIAFNAAVLAGADSSGRVKLYTPNPFQSGLSVNHFDPSTQPSQLMAPAINGDVLHSVVPPADLTFPLLQDIGW